MAKSIGDIIKQKIREDGRTAIAISEELGMSRGNLDKIYKKDSLNSDLLAKLSIILGYDLFRHVNPFRNGTLSAEDILRLTAREPNQYDMAAGELGECIQELQAAEKELEYLQQSVGDLKASMHDKDEIIGLQKEKIDFLNHQIKELKSQL